MHAVIDACSAVHIVRKEPGYESQRDALSYFETVIAPELYFIETASALRKYVIAQTLSNEEAVELLRETEAFIDTSYPLRDNYIEAFRESLRLKHSVYDMLYFTLARRTGATLITNDEKLFQLAAREGVAVLVDL